LATVYNPLNSQKSFDGFQWFRTDNFNLFLTVGPFLFFIDFEYLRLGFVDMDPSLDEKIDLQVMGSLHLLAQIDNLVRPSCSLDVDRYDDRFKNRILAFSINLRHI
jgi:hypothetical protein